MKIYTPRFIFNSAIEFYNLGSDRCKQIFTGDYLNDKSLYLKVPAPATNLSFSVELILKALLLYRNGKHPKEHSLQKLYYSLPSDDQGGIERIYSNADIDKQKFPSIRYIALDYKNQNTSSVNYSSIKEEMSYELVNHDYSFVKWRYVFSFPEKNDEGKLEYNFSFIMKLFEAIFDYSKPLINS